jgi:hypothetical protein
VIASMFLSLQTYGVGLLNSITTLKSGDMRVDGKCSNCSCTAIGGRICHAMLDSTARPAICAYELKHKSESRLVNYYHSQSPSIPGM